MKVVYIHNGKSTGTALRDFTAKFVCTIEQSEHSYCMIFIDEWENQGGE